MKFLQKIGFLGLLLGLAAATPRDEEATAPRAIQITCAGRVWEDGKRIGTFVGGGDVYTTIVNGRIYITHNGGLQSNLGVLYNMPDRDDWPAPGQTGAIDALVKGCVNPPDPYTRGFNFLQPAPNGAISCNGKVITNDMLLATFVGGDQVHTEVYAKIKDGFLRTYNWRKTESNRPDPEVRGYDMSLLWDAINGSNGFPNTSLGFPLTDDNPNDSDTRGYVLSRNEIDGCFWAQPPVPLVTTLPCAVQPSLQSVSLITMTSLSFNFSGAGITGLYWRIKPITANSANERSGSTGTISGSTVAISYAGLPAGDYRLEIEGESCTSTTATYNFTINCVPTTISSISEVKTSSLKITFGAPNNNPLDYAIKNSSGTTVLSGRITTSSNATSHILKYPTLPAGTYTIDIQSTSCPGGSSSRTTGALASQTFEVPVTENRTACEAGPELKWVASVTRTGATFNFHGSEVYSIAWRILNSAKTAVVANSVDDIAPTSNTMNLSYNLSDGNYWLEIQGGTTCKSTPSLLALDINATPLPIRIANFKGETKAEGVNLTWDVVSEENGDKFQVLRFDDSQKTASIIGEVRLREQSVGKYEFLDRSPASGNNYYQLKQVDKDATFSLSRIITLKYEQLFKMLLAPNPAKDYVDVNFESRVNGIASFETYNISGVRVQSTSQNVKIGNNKVRINVSGLAEGNYVLRINNKDQAQGLRFLKLR